MKRSGINFSPAGEAVAGSEEIQRKKRGSTGTRRRGNEERGDVERK